MCEAAGFDVVIVETVGVGQSEIGVHAMVDFFAVLLQPGAGDQLQGMKRGVLELADALVVTKADGDQKALAERTRVEHAQALELLRSPSQAWTPRVTTTSARTGEGVDGALGARPGAPRGPRGQRRAPGPPGGPGARLDVEPGPGGPRAGLPGPSGRGPAHPGPRA